MYLCIIPFKWNQLVAHCFLVYLFQLFYMFRATMYPSSAELTVSMRHCYFSLVWVAFWSADQTATQPVSWMTCNRSAISSTIPVCRSIPWQYMKLKVQLCAPDDWLRYRPKHVELLEINNRKYSHLLGSNCNVIHLNIIPHLWRFQPTHKM